MDEEFIQYVVKSIVSKPDDVQIDRSIDERGVLLELTVNPDDLGRVIGKRGNTAQSMRTLLRALGTKDSARYNLKIIDNGDPDYDKNKNNDDNSDDSASNDKSADDSSHVDNDADTNSDDVTADAGGAGQWSHMSSSADETDESSTTETNESQEDESSTSSTSQSVEQTKKELADLDDLQL